MQRQLQLMLLFLATAGFAAAGANNVSAVPVAPAANSTAVLPRVRVLENRFFFHNYEQDPIEKRLQRLELLVFGQTKSGNDQERLQHLNVTIAERDRESALKMQRQHQASNSSSSTPPSSSESLAAQPEPKKPEGSAVQPKAAPRATAGGTQHYPAVTALEWRALKKSYPNDSLDDRLGRLETKLFGQPGSTMSYADRVERLNRTLGIGAVASAPGSKFRGPLPKTRPQGEGQPFYDPGSSMPFFGNSENFGFFGGYPDSNQKQITELFKQMNEQMEEMMRITPGFVPYPEDFSAPTPSKKKHNNLPGLKIPQSPPPYNDPNSI